MATTGILNGTALLLYVDGTAVAHSTSHTLSVSHATRDATTKDSSGWEDALNGLRSWEASGEGLVAFDAAYGYSDLFALITARSTVTIKLSTEVTGDKYYEGSALLTSLEESAGTEENISFSYTFKGTGALTEYTGS